MLIFFMIATFPPTDSAHVFSGDGSDDESSESSSSEVGGSSSGQSLHLRGSGARPVTCFLQVLTRLGFIAQDDDGNGNGDGVGGGDGDSDGVSDGGGDGRSDGDSDNDAASARSAEVITPPKGGGGGAGESGAPSATPPTEAGGAQGATTSPNAAKPDALSSAGSAVDDAPDSDDEVRHTKAGLLVSIPAPPLSSTRCLALQGCCQGTSSAPLGRC